jgi:opacity protein-like surface antigen
MSRKLIVVGAVSAVLLTGTSAAAHVQPTTHGVATPTSPLDGRWTATITQAQLQRSGAGAELVTKLFGPWTARWDNGRFQFRNLRTHTVARGTFTVRRNVSRLVFASGVGIQPGAVSECTWSIYRGRLTFKRIAERPSLLCDAGVWSRVS